jgi:predicted AlkP superfamily phosphohydrolase/phosphomutase
MMQNEGRYVLAIGVDAAEPSLVRELMERGEMPVLKSLSDAGVWLRVESPAYVGSGSVWPTFITGSAPAEHGTYGEWCWRPDAMGLERYHGRGLRPFWEALVREGSTVGVLDVPFMPLLGLTKGFEISEWGAHDVLDGRMNFSPGEIERFVANGSTPHPLSLDRLDTAGADDYEALKRLSAGCLEGVRLRGELMERLLRETRPRFAQVVFTEVHHSAHHLWHTVAPGHRFYDGVRECVRPVAPTLEDIYREVDRQTGRLIAAAPEGALVMVFSLHGMQPTRGIPSFLGPLLCESGFARLADWGTQTWRERAVSVMAACKRRTPSRLKRLYYRTLPQAATQRLAQPTMMPAYDWARTRAFALPTDQHGWVRINLAGREALGVVPPERYEETCREVEAMLRALVNEDGSPLAREVIRTAGRAEDALRLSLPDLIVHWHDSAYETPLKIRGRSTQAPPVGLKFTGQHALDGFCIIRGHGAAHAADTIRVEEMHRRILEHLAGE